MPDTSTLLAKMVLMTEPNSEDRKVAVEITKHVLLLENSMLSIANPENSCHGGYTGPWQEIAQRALFGRTITPEEWASFPTLDPSLSDIRKKIAQ